jgi:hypothetical protein
MLIARILEKNAPALFCHYTLKEKVLYRFLFTRK